MSEEKPRRETLMEILSFRGNTVADMRAKILILIRAERRAERERCIDACEGQKCGADKCHDRDIAAIRALPDVTSEEA